MRLSAASASDRSGKRNRVPSKCDRMSQPKAQYGADCVHSRRVAQGDMAGECGLHAGMATMAQHLIWEVGPKRAGHEINTLARVVGSKVWQIFTVWVKDGEMPPGDKAGDICKLHHRTWSDHKYVFYHPRRHRTAEAGKRRPVRWYTAEKPMPYRPAQPEHVSTSRTCQHIVA